MRVNFVLKMADILKSFVIIWPLTTPFHVKRIEVLHKIDTPVIFNYRSDKRLAGKYTFHICIEL